MNNIPRNCIYDATSETFVHADSFVDESGELVAPYGYSFVQAEVQATPTGTPAYRSIPGTPTYINFPSTPNMGYGAAYGNLPATPYGGYTTPMVHQHGFLYCRAQPFHSRVNIKETLVENVFDAIKTCTTSQGVWVNLRQENEGYHTVRTHLKKKQDIAVTPMIVQKIISEIGIVEFSMHYLKRESGVKNGLTIYMRLRKRNDDVEQAIREFAIYKIHARRVRQPPKDMVEPEVEAPQRKTKSRSSILITTPSSKPRSVGFSLKKKNSQKKNARRSKSSMLLLVKSETRSSSRKSARDLSTKFVSVNDPEVNSKIRKFEDEDPDLDESADDIFAGNESQHSIRKPRTKSKSRTISVLIPDSLANDIKVKADYKKDRNA